MVGDLRNYRPWRDPAMTQTPDKSAPIGLGICGLGMAGAVMVQAAAAHPGYALRAAADPHPGPREAFARDFNASAYADMTELCADKAVEVDLHRDAAPVPRAARHHGGRARQAHHPGKADGADARRLRRHHRGGGAQQGAAHRRPHPRVRSGGARDARHDRERRAGPARHDQLASTTRLISIVRAGRRSSTPRRAAASCSTRCRTRSTRCACSAAAW